MGLIIRFIVSAVVLQLLALVLPGFAIAGFVNALLTAVVIAVLGYFAESLLGKNASPQARGFAGFIVSALVIYLAQYVISAFQVSVIGALLAAFLIGVIDMVVPTELR